MTLAELVKEIIKDVDDLKKSAAALEGASKDQDRRWKLKELEYHHHFIITRARVIQCKLLGGEKMAEEVILDEDLFSWERINDKGFIWN